jgi:hypothetical protein
MGVSYLVCLGRDPWKELVGALEAEIWVTPSVPEEPVSESDEQMQIEEAHLEEGMASGQPGCRQMSVRPETRHRRWAAHWDDDAVWGDLDADGLRRLKRLLGGA